ncbi:Long-chain-fatty-acid--CoA ligase ACSBG2, partial [Ophiophagus hannah]
MSKGKGPAPGAGGLWTTKRDGEVKLRMDESGIDSKTPITIHDLFLATVEKYGHLPALASKKQGQWSKLTFCQYYEECRKTAKSFLKVSGRGWAWSGSTAFASWASTPWSGSWRTSAPFLLGKTTTHTPASPRGKERGVPTWRDGRRLRCRRGFEPSRFFLREGFPARPQPSKGSPPLQGAPSLELERAPGTLRWNEFMELGSSVPDEQLDKVLASLKPNQCCTIIYTSGTTGNPKGITWTARAAGDYVHLKTALEGQESVISYLPLSHVAAQMIDIWLPVTFGVETYFAQPDALKGSLVDTLREVRPTAFMGVPRVWEKMQERMKSVGAKSSTLRKKIAVWAKAVGLETNLKRMNGSIELPMNYRLARALVYRKVRKALGLDRCTKCYTGAAPIMKDTLDVETLLCFAAMGSPRVGHARQPLTLCLTPFPSPSSCGKEITGCQTMFFKPDQEGVGEVCFAGRHVFMGYLNMEDKTKEAIDSEGWLHSGDLGRQDEDGFLYITGRIKELIITAGGENIPPIPIEDAIKEAVPILSNVMLVGDKAKYLVMLMTLKSKMNLETGVSEDELTPEAVQFCQKLGSKSTKVSDIVGNKDLAVYTAIQKGVMKVNDQATSNAQKIQKWLLLNRDFTIQNGELGDLRKVASVRWGNPNEAPSSGLSSVRAASTWGEGW